MFQLGTEALATEFRQRNPTSRGFLPKKAPVFMGQKNGDLFANMGRCRAAGGGEPTGSIPATFDGDRLISDDAGQVARWRSHVFGGRGLPGGNGVGETKFIVENRGVAIGFAGVFRRDTDFTNHDVGLGGVRKTEMQIS